MADAAASMRVDRFLWFTRLAKTRSAAQGLCEAGHLRIDGRPCDRAHAGIRVGHVLTFAQGSRVRVLRVTLLPARRGPATEAQGCYVDLIPADPAVRNGANVSQDDRCD